MAVRQWKRLRSHLARKKLRYYGLRVAEPHHDGTPHWHALVWVETEAAAQQFEAALRRYWLMDAGDERGAQANPHQRQRMVGGGAAGYIAKYIAKSIGHIALREHLDVVEGQASRWTCPA